MNKPLSRRLFGKAMAAMPMAAQQAAKTLAVDSAATAAAGQMAMAGANMATSAGPPMFGSYILNNPRVWALWKSGIAPEWVHREIDNEIRERSRTIDPDIWGMKSISANAKLRMNHGRLRASITESIEKTTMLTQAARAFWNEEDKSTMDRPQSYP